MYPAWVWDTFLLLGLVWLCILTYFFWKERKIYKKFFPNEQDKDFTDKLKEILANLKEGEIKDRLIIKNQRQISFEGLSHLQNIAVLRYNPYEDTGGSMSFSLALLDGHSNGVVLTSLHTRAGTRVYTKEIKKGESEIALSKEEEQVIEKAINK
ncbi:DUF4446 family protein [Candidatus Daviesbacteria bacterium]|nr:DUF4446 family protein [Candidatus Daviesbacteria bacterium]